MKLVRLLESTGISLNENAGEHQFSCTMLDMPQEVCRAIEVMQGSISEGDLAGEGVETEPHITIVYGTHTSNVNEVKEVLCKEQDGPIKFVIGKLSTFPPSKHSDGASVLKLDIECEELHRLNSVIRDELECTCSFPDYHPHCTIAYVKTDRVGDLIKKLSNKLEGQEFSSSKITFSKQDGEQVKFDLCNS